jgi:hypothetical protein
MLMLTMFVQLTAYAADQVTFEMFKRDFAASAKFDGESRLGLRACKDQPTLDKKGRAYSCEMGDNGFVDGLMSPDRQLRRVSVTQLIGSEADIHLFRRGVKYTVHAVTGRRDGLQTLSDLMAQARRNGRAATAIMGDMEYFVEQASSFGDQRIPTWTFSLRRISP